eukprot:CAMPEP_0118931584 /NCGR_PEP_ID=MMETSP1169-20130426/7871_1 /TAXON_ID=36882 /ORGANISM="Pyramimonas obovata, Strain CCMP722" /LENGTH=52 /DNA_ID=CAMNT_0006874097 /DNA_START=258 /DNA_END=416 /DNA_ORIENTATION=+
MHTEEPPREAAGATVHRVSEEIEWRRNEVHEASLRPRTSVDEEAVLGDGGGG